MLWVPVDRGLGTPARWYSKLCQNMMCTLTGSKKIIQVEHIDNNYPVFLVSLPPSVSFLHFSLSLLSLISMVETWSLKTLCVSSPLPELTGLSPLQILGNFLIQIWSSPPWSPNPNLRHIYISKGFNPHAGNRLRIFKYKFQAFALLW